MPLRAIDDCGEDRKGGKDEKAISKGSGCHGLAAHHGLCGGCDKPTGNNNQRSVTRFKRKKEFSMKESNVMSRIFLLFLVIGLAFAACDLDGAQETIQEYLGGGTIKADKLSSIIGHGYDLTGRYADAQSVKAAILDFDKLAAADQIKRNPNVSQGLFETISGSTVTEYQNNFATSVAVSAKGGVDGIATSSTEITTTFGSERTGRDDYSFATAQSAIMKDAYYVDDRDTSRLLDYVSSAFAADMETKTSEELIERYGTHVVLGDFFWGGAA
jgi:hypothetical protein